MLSCCTDSVGFTHNQLPEKEGMMNAHCGMISKPKKLLHGLFAAHGMRFLPFARNLYEKTFPGKPVSIQASKQASSS
jgi:hypothetical protein